MVFSAAKFVVVYYAAIENKYRLNHVLLIIDISIYTLMGVRHRSYSVAMWTAVRWS